MSRQPPTPYPPDKPAEVPPSTQSSATRDEEAHLDVSENMFLETMLPLTLLFYSYADTFSLYPNLTNRDLRTDGGMVKRWWTAFTRCRDIGSEFELNVGAASAEDESETWSTYGELGDTEDEDEFKDMPPLMSVDFGIEDTLWGRHQDLSISLDEVGMPLQRPEGQVWPDEGARRMDGSENRDDFLEQYLLTLSYDVLCHSGRYD
ncbi:hypothetical protein V5O48_018519 [Marasmius crinis-equi]|uniref:Uncharacterized protein n=1 Tax=Marasmius crinis-equi TaxID=585013 RepID=A0ABR3EKX4_9AGAR